MPYVPSSTSLAPATRVPALGMLELDSIAVGIRSADAMAKRAPIRLLVAGSVQPGKFLVLIDGDVASVEESMAAGDAAASGSCIARLLLPEAHPAVGNAIAGRRWMGAIEALGVIETSTALAAIRAADAGMKGATVELVELRLANGLGGKGLCFFAGEVSDVEAAVELARDRVGAELVESTVIPRLSTEMAESLRAGTRFAGAFGQSEG